MAKALSCVASQAKSLSLIHTNKLPVASYASLLYLATSPIISHQPPAVVTQAYTAAFSQAITEGGNAMLGLSSITAVVVCQALPLATNAPAANNFMRLVMKAIQSLQCSPEGVWLVATAAWCRRRGSSRGSCCTAPGRRSLQGRLPLEGNTSRTTCCQGKVTQAVLCNRVRILCLTTS